MDASRRRSDLRRRNMSIRAAAAVLAVISVTVSACGNFSAATPDYTVQPSLTAPVVTPVLPQQLPASTAPQSSPSSSAGATPSTSPTPKPSTTGSSAPADPCLPADPAVVAACLSAPFGLAPLSDGKTALVGERTTGKILKVAAGQKPLLLTTIAGIDATGDGGLLGIALSPSYSEDGLIYAYVTTATDNRVIRIAAGDKPKPILTGIPKGRTNNGGQIHFGPDGSLYVGTGNAGTAAPPATSLAGKLLRVDESGKPVKGNPVPTSAIYSSGFTQITGMCLLPTGAMAAVDHRADADVLLNAKAGKDYAKLASGDAVWTWKAGDGGAADCAYSAGMLTNTSLVKQQLAGVALSAKGTFSGTPQVILGATYGRLLTVQTGLKNALWMTTSNKDGHGKPVAADDRVIILPDSGGGSGSNSPD